MLARLPEPEVVMESADSVAAFDAAGSSGRPLMPIYHFNATRLSRLLPAGATVLDLACGSARFLRYLLQGRPDLRAVGLDLSTSMLALARQNLAEAGLSDRVELVHADWTRADHVVRTRVGAVTCLSALHHCPTPNDLRMVLEAVARIRRRDGAAVWLFDLSRPETETLIELIPRTHEMASGRPLPEAFRQDWITSLRAGWTGEELARTLQSTGLNTQSVTANYSQLHYLPSTEGPPPTPEPWQGPELLPAELDRSEKMAAAFGWA